MKLKGVEMQELGTTLEETQEAGALNGAPDEAGKDNEPELPTLTIPGTESMQTGDEVCIVAHGTVTDGGDVQIDMAGAEPYKAEDKQKAFQNKADNMSMDDLNKNIDSMKPDPNDKNEY